MGSAAITRKKHRRNPNVDKTKFSIINTIIIADILLKMEAQFGRFTPERRQT